MPEPIKIHDLSFGFFMADKKGLADYFGVSTRCIDKWRKAREVPDAYRSKVEVLQKFELFPIDALPINPEIGRTLSRAFKALRHGEEEVAYALATLAANKDALQLETGTAHGGTIPALRLHFANLIQCMALVRSPVEPGQQVLRVIREFLRKIVQHLPSRPIDGRSAAWAYLTAMAYAYWLTHLGMRFELASEDHRLFKRRLRIAKHVLWHAVRKRVLDHVRQLPNVSHARDFLIYNLMQFAAIAKDEFIFIRCLKILYNDYRSPFFWKFIIPTLGGDDDTGLMLEYPKVKALLRALKRGDDDDEAAELIT